MDPLISLEQDPASNRLSGHDVVEIHKRHMAGMPWNDIAEDFDITRTNVRRIIQGRRWPNLHPSRAPRFYANGSGPEPQSPEPQMYTIDQIRKAAQAARDAFIDALNH